MISRIAISYIFMLGAMLTAAYASDDSLVPLRQLYQQAQAALSVHDMRAFENLRPRLITYPLYPYLLFADLKSRLRSATDEEILIFIKTYHHTPLAARLRKAWLNTLADENLRDKLKPNYSFSIATKNGIKRYIALRAVYRQHPDAINWLQVLPANATDQQVREWLARAAMRNAE
jgi:hypothetical protein